MRTVNVINIIKLHVTIETGKSNSKIIHVIGNFMTYYIKNMLRSKKLLSFCHYLFKGRVRTTESILLYIFFCKGSVISLFHYPIPLYAGSNTSRENETQDAESFE